MKQTDTTTTTPPQLNLSGLENCQKELQTFLKSTLSTPGLIDPEHRLKIIDLLADLNDLLIDLRIDALHSKDLIRENVG